MAVVSWSEVWLTSVPTASATASSAAPRRNFTAYERAVSSAMPAPTMIGIAANATTTATLPPLAPLSRRNIGGDAVIERRNSRSRENIVSLLRTTIVGVQVGGHAIHVARPVH